MTIPRVGQIRRRLRRWRRRGLGPGLVVAVSGGGDSVGLLRVLHALAPEFDLQLAVAHLDHGVRGEAAAADARFVAELAAALGLPCDLGHWQPSRPGHFEADARRARYAWLAGVAAARGASGVAVGHTRDDQAETILHRILRGTGPRGLAGMPSRRPLSASVALLRPVLGVSRQELRDHLAAIGQEYRDDATNADVARTRARIRHDLLPRLAAEYNPHVADALVRLGQLAGASARGLGETLRAMERDATIAVDAERVLLKRPVLRGFPRFLRAEVLRRVWRRAGWPEAGMSARRWQRIASLAGRSQVRASVGEGIELITSPEFVVLARVTAEAEAEPPRRGPVPLALPGSAAWDGGRIVATLDPADPRDETVDLDALHPPLFVRAPAPGDRFAPLGMAHEQSLNDFFRGRRVPGPRRVRTPLVCDQRGILWVVGHRIGHRVRRTAATRRTLGLRWEPEWVAGDG